MKIVLILFIVFFVIPAISDEIVLNDGTVIKGNIIRVTPKAIEYDPEGAKPFDMVPRGQIQRVIYEDGSIVNFKEMPSTNEKLSTEEIKLSGFFIETEWGWNGYVGLGMRMDYRIIKFCSVNAGLGRGLWGWRMSSGLRFYKNYPFGMAFGLGIAYNMGVKGLERKLEIVDNAGSETKEELLIDFNSVTTINASFLYSWSVGKSGKFYIEVGYAFQLQSERYSYELEGNEGNIQLTDDSKDDLDFLHPGGPIISLGYAYNI